ncbi:MAG: response regulator [Gemmatimonadales bacterium]
MPDPESLRVLVVEDDPATARLIHAILRAHGYQRITPAGTIAEALAAASDADLIILDQELPDGLGLDAVPRLVSRPEPPSVIMVTGAGNEGLAAAALRNGADDYLPKNAQLPVLLPEIVERCRRKRALAEAQTAVERELIMAERVAAIGEMTVTLHHEINNPLMSATAETELLRSRTDLPAEAAEGLESIQQSLVRIRDIIRKAADLRQAAAANYLEGLRMINLAGAAEEPTINRGRALLWIPSEDVGRVVALLLRHAGFTVERVGTARELGTASNRLGVSLVVLAVPGSATAAGALGDFTLPDDRGYAVVALVAGDGTGARLAGADRVVALPIDPATLGREFTDAVDQHLG